MESVDRSTRGTSHITRSALKSPKCQREISAIELLLFGADYNCAIDVLDDCLVTKCNSRVRNANTRFVRSSFTYRFIFPEVPSHLSSKVPSTLVNIFMKGL